jgi:hypothetical protein
METKTKLEEEFKYLQENYTALCHLYGLEEIKKPQKKKKNEDVEGNEENLEKNDLFSKKNESLNNFVKTVQYNDVRTYGSSFFLDQNTK